MAKFKVYELAKEIDETGKKVSGKDVLAFLQQQGVEVKAVQSSVDDATADMVRKHFGVKAEEATKADMGVKESEASKAEEVKKEEKNEAVKVEVKKEAEEGKTEDSKKEEAPKKKKNIIFVSNPQHSKMPGGQRQVKPNNQKPNNQKPANQKPAQENKPAPKPIQLGPNQMINKSTGKVMEMLPPKKPEVVEEPIVVVQEEKVPVKANRENGNNRNNQERANTQERTNNQERSNNQERFNHQERSNNSPNRFNERGNDRGNDKGSSRPQGEDRRTGDRNYANKPGQRGNNSGSFGDRQNGGNGKGSYQNNGNNKDGGRNFKDNERSQGRNDRQDSKFQSKKDNKSFASEAPIIQNDKHREEQRRLNQVKDKRSKKDALYEEKEVEIKNKNKAGRFIKPEPKQAEPEEQIKVITVPETITIKELAEKMKMQPAAIIKKLFMQGKIVTVNQEITFEDAENIAIEYDIMCEQEVKVDVIEELLKEDEEAEENMVSRAPVICVMGHVDHGKTSLLDAIRKTNVTNKEAGGITQHIGAYSVSINGQKITFLDTPGHEAFTAMRMRGANATDIAILVVAADDGVKPQTIEAINHAKAAGIEVIVAVNKIDKPAANIERVKQELTEYELIAEDWGGSTVFAPVSAKTGEGIQELLEMILLTADILELKANPKRKARGLVIEAQLDKGRGPVATVLVQKGTLKIGDFISAGACHGKVRAMIDDKGRRVKEAGPSTPVEILGLNDVPNAGEVFLAHDNDKTAKQYAETFVAQNKEKKLEETKSKMSLDDLFSQIQEGNLKELNLIVKADVQGSVEAVKQSLMKLSNEEVVVKCIHGGVGAISESDVTLAATSSAIIIGFNVRPDATAKATAEREGVDIRLYKVIYQAIEDIEAAMKGMLDPVFEEKILGHAEVRQIFKASQIGNIAGSYVLDGIFQRGCKVRITREGEQIFEGELASLKRFKDDVKEVKAGFECGLVFEGFDKMQEFDIVEAYTMVEVPR